MSQSAPAKTRVLGVVELIERPNGECTMNSDSSVLEQCRAMLANGADIESVLCVLRDNGFSKVHSIKALVDLGQVSLAEAKRVVP